jgi:hypothetical protein
MFHYYAPDQPDIEIQIQKIREQIFLCLEVCKDITSFISHIRKDKRYILVLLISSDMLSLLSVCNLI